MKKRIIFLVLLAFVIINLLNISANTIPVTGQATSQPTNVSVYVLPAVPVLTIISPTATTYDEGEYILLDYTAILIDTVWYNLDNSQNITINQSFYFQASVGTHTLYLYGNQSNGTVLSDNVTFTVESRRGGGGRIVPVPEEEIAIEVEKEIIEVDLQQGEEKTISLFIENNEDQRVSINLEDLNLEDILINMSETSFLLDAGQRKEVLVTFRAAEDKIPDIYIEKILIKTDNSEKQIIFYIEVESKELLFDVEIEILEKPAVFQPGDEISANIMLYNLKNDGQTEIGLEYLIRTPEGDTVLGEKETLIVETSMNLVKKFILPEEIEEGDYLFYVKATYDSKTASASELFEVVKRIGLPKPINDVVKALKDNEQNIAKGIAAVVGFYILVSILKILGVKSALGVFGKNLFGAAAKKRVVKEATTRALKTSVNQKF
jgi:hypothetical protein